MRKTVALSAVVVTALAQSALAADRNVPSAFPRIADAVAAANAGDRIVVSHGVYQENVVSTLANLQFVAKGAVVWDGTLVNGTAGVCLTASGGGTVVTGFTFRAGQTGVAQVQLTGDDCRVTKCTARGSYARFLKVTGNRVLVESCRLFAVNSTAIEIIGNDAVVRKLTTRHCDDRVVLVTGSGAIAANNTFLDTEDSYSIEILGNNGAVTANRFRNCDFCVHVVGDGMSVTLNRVSACDFGFLLKGDGLTASDNSFAGMAGGSATDSTSGISASSTTGTGGGAIERNTVTEGLFSGFRIATNNVTVRGNRATRCGITSSAGFLVSGTANTFDTNVATRCGPRGFDVAGTDNHLVGCTATNSLGDGFRVGGTGVTLDRCRATGSGGEGLDNRGTNTSVANSRFQKNRIDVANAGTFANFAASNVFGTGGTSQAPQVD